MSCKALYDKILDDIAARSVWSERQRVWYTMRNEGLKRRKPFPGASNLHFPLIDQSIDRLKPFYLQQLYATELFASFISRRQQDPEITTTAARVLDDRLRNRSDFILETMHAVDAMLQSNKGVLKIFWDFDKQQLGFDSIDPLYVIVPPETKRICNADRVTLVRHLSVEQYKRIPYYDQSPEFIKSITGAAQAEQSTSTETNKSEKERREGITYGKTNQIIIWEVYERRKDGWVVLEFSPLQAEKTLRAMKLPFKHGRLPLVEFHMEVKDKGYYSPRGVAELVAPFEASACSMWNGKHDYMAFANQPGFTCTSPVPNVANIRMAPGQIYPFGLQPIVMPAPPVSYDQEMQQIRGVAEQRIGIPDNGLKKPGQTGDPRTATEVEMIGALSMQSNDLRAIIFRLALTEIYQQAWSLLRQYDSDLTYLFQGSFQQADSVALHDEYEITPSGDNGSWNREAQMKKAIWRWQMFQGNPFINQAELTKSVLVLDDPALVKTLFQDPNAKQADEIEDEAKELLLLKEGFPVQLHPAEDHAARAITDAQYLQATLVKNQPLPPDVVQGIEAHIMAHIQALGQQNPQAAKQTMAEIQAIGQQTPMLLQQQNQAEAQAALQRVSGGAN